MSAVAITIQALLAASGVTALVGSRIEPDVVPQGSAYPVIRVYLVSEGSEPGLAQDSAPYMARVSVEAVGDRSLDVHAVAEAVKAAFEGYRNQTVLARTVSIFRQGSDASLYDDPAKKFRRVTDYMVGWK